MLLFLSLLLICCATDHHLHGFTPVLFFLFSVAFLWRGTRVREEGGEAEGAACTLLHVLLLWLSR